MSLWSRPKNKRFWKWKIVQILHCNLNKANDIFCHVETVGQAAITTVVGTWACGLVYYPKRYKGTLVIICGITIK